MAEFSDSHNQQELLSQQEAGDQDLQGQEMSSLPDHRLKGALVLIMLTNGSGRCHETRTCLYV